MEMSATIFLVCSRSDFFMTTKCNPKLINWYFCKWIFLNTQEFGYIRPIKIDRPGSAASTAGTGSVTISWTAHNNQLKAKGEIRYNRFLILIVDESQAGASGCSIDKSVPFYETAGTTL